MSQTILYLIRHGETDWNAESRLQGQIDIPLNSQGEAQAALLAQELQHNHLGAIYSSPLQRALKTAETINLYHRHEIQVDPLLQEAAYGSLEGKTKDEYRDRLEKIGYLSPEERFSFKLCPDAESYEEVYQRAFVGIKRVIQNHPNQTVVIVTHGGLMRAVVAKVANIDVGQVYIQNIGVMRLLGDKKKLDLLDYKRIVLK